MSEAPPNKSEKPKIRKVIEKDVCFKVDDSNGGPWPSSILNP